MCLCILTVKEGSSLTGEVRSMSLLYLGVMVLLQIAGYDMISGEVIDLQVLIGTVFASVAGILKIWSQVSR